MSAADQQADSTMQRFFRWLEEHDCDFSFLEVRTVNGRRGLFAHQDIPAGARVLRVPRRTILSSEVSKGSPIGQHLQAHKVELPNTAWLAVFIAHNQRQPHTFWRPYFDVLPTDYSDLPINFTPEEFRFLRGSSLEQETIDTKRAWLSEHHRINSCLDGPEQFSYVGYAWARAVASTRCHRAELNGIVAQAIVPGACMMNHQFRPKSNWPFAPDMSQAFFKVAGIPIVAGEEIFEDYGDKPNATLLGCYGIHIDDNPHDATDLMLIRPTQEHLFHDEASKLGKDIHNEQTFLLPLKHDHTERRKLFAYLRLINEYNPEAIRTALANNANIEKLPAISQQNELAAMTILAAACERRLARFATTIEADEHILTTETLPYKLRCTVKVRLGEKRILKHYLSLAKAAIPLLAIHSDMLLNALVAHCNSNSDFSPYFKELVQQLYPTVATSIPGLQQEAA